MKLFLAIQLFIGFVGSLLLAEIKGNESAASYACGCGLIFLNVLTLTILWSFIYRKKFVALSVAIIIFKYAILGVILYKLFALPWVDKIWLCVGLGSLLVTTLLFAVLAPERKDEG